MHKAKGVQSSEKKNNVKRLRRSRNLSQTDMAKELKIPQTRISSWELGKSQINEEGAEMLAEFFGVTAAYVVRDTMDKYEQFDEFDFFPEEDKDNYHARDYNEVELLECYRFMEGAGKHYLMQTVAMLKKFYGME